VSHHHQLLTFFMMVSWIRKGLLSRILKGIHLVCYLLVNLENNLEHFTYLNQINDSSSSI
jgi:hypothetical protein